MITYFDMTSGEFDTIDRAAQAADWRDRPSAALRLQAVCETTAPSPSMPADLARVPIERLLDRFAE